MTKFEIYTDNFELRFGAARHSLPAAMSPDEVFEAYMEQNCREPQLEASFDTLEAAQAAFAANFGDAGRTWAEKGSNFWFLRGEVAWIEENDYTEDGEFDQTSCTYAFSAEAFRRDDEDEE